MPKAPRAKRSPKKSRRAPKEPPSVFDIADAMETPLARAEYLVRALEYVGYGLSSLEEDSAPAVFAIAQALSENLEAVKNSWKKLFDRAPKHK
jgi:hypothetical protein